MPQAFIILLAISAAALGAEFDHPFFKTHTGEWINKTTLTTVEGDNPMESSEVWRGAVEGEEFRVTGSSLKGRRGKYEYTYTYTLLKDETYAMAYEDSLGAKANYVLKLTGKDTFSMTGVVGGGAMRVTIKGKFTMNRIERRGTYATRDGEITHKAVSIGTRVKEPIE